eukprot:6105934-Alexandrium_andersonii.AAC.1
MLRAAWLAQRLYACSAHSVPRPAPVMSVTWCCTCVCRQNAFAANLNSQHVAALHQCGGDRANGEARARTGQQGASRTG